MNWLNDLPTAKFGDVGDILDLTPGLLNIEYRTGVRHKIFVYGTMKRGFRNHDRIRQYDSTLFLGNFVTHEEFSMQSKISTGEYVAPVVTKDGNSAIRGELYEISGDVLHKVDVCEGHPLVYQRVPIQLASYPHIVHTYVYPDTFRGMKERVMESDGESWFINEDKI